MTDSANIASWIKDLIQIGIPSLVTLVSLLVTFLLGKASHQKDIAIANLSSESEKRKITSERKANLIKNIATALTEVENACGTYSGIFRRTRKDTPVPISASQELQDAFCALSSAIDKCCGARTATYLLGDSRVGTLFELYLQKSFEFQQQANPPHGADPIDLTNSFVALSSRQKELLGRLSDLYLDEKCES